MNISVVIASYNHAPFIADCIRSALDQSLAPAEIIVIDDGSTDRSQQVIESFGNRVKPVFQQNRGTYATLNAGIEMAGCEWVAIHNSDDLWSSDKLARQAEIAGAHAEVGLIHTGVEYMDDTANTLQEVPGADLRSYSAPASYEALPVVLRTNPVVISSVLLSKSVWQAAGKFDPRYLGMGDWEFCVRAAEHARFGFAPGPLTRVRKHAASAGMNAEKLPSNWGSRDWLRLIGETMPRAAVALVSKARERKVDREDAAVALASLGTLQTREGHKREARETFRMAIRLAPLRAKTYARYLAAL